MSRYDPKEEDVSYIQEMLFHPINIGSIGGVFLFTAIFLIASGPALAIAPILLYVTLLILSSLFIPDLKSFKDYINQEKRKESREADHNRLIEELSKYTRMNIAFDQYGRRDPQRDSTELSTYLNLKNRVEKFYEMANTGGGLSTRDVEKIEDMMLDYLRMWLATYVLEEREASVDKKELERKISRLNQEMEGKSFLEKKKLTEASEGLQKVLLRQKSLSSQKEAASAKMLMIADGIEELFSRKLSGPSSVSDFLEEQLGQLNVEDELDMIGVDFKPSIEQKINSFKIPQR